MRLQLIVAGAIALTACSSNDGGGAPASTSASPVSEPATMITPTSTTPRPTGATTTTDPYAEYCGLATEYGDRLDADPFAQPAPDVVEAYFDSALPLLGELADAAPPSIADDVAVLVDLFSEMDTALAAADYDVFASDLSFLADRDSDAQAASDAIDAFEEEFCGLPRPPTDADLDLSVFAAGALRDQFLRRLTSNGFTVDEATCVFDHLDFTDPDSITDPATLHALLAECGIHAERLAELTRTLDATLEGDDVTGTTVAEEGDARAPAVSA